MVLPWTASDEDLAELAEYYPDAGEQGVITIKAFYKSGFGIPVYAMLAFYIFLVSLVAINISRRTLRFIAPDFYGKARARLAYLRAYILNAPLYGRKHSEPSYVFGRRWLPVRAPLRFQSFVIFALIVFNLVPIFACYDITPDWNIYWPGPTSHRDQLVRYVADRSAVLAMGQLPIAFFTSGRYSLLSLLTGIEYSDSMLYHRWMARMIWLQVSIHSGAYTYIEAINGYLGESFKEAYFAWGIAATAMFWGLTILAYGQLRTKFYELFVALHIVMGIMALVGTYFHIHLLDYWKYKMFIVLTEISAAAWAFDRTLRAANRIWTSCRIRKHGYVSTATLTTHGEGLIRLRITLPLSRVQLPGDSLTAHDVIPRIAPGHSVRILVPRVQFFSDHPFTVIGTGKLSEEGNDDAGYVDLLIRQQQGFTRQLSKLQTLKNNDADVEVNQAVVRQSAVIVEGPYGGLHYEDVHDAGQVLLFAGGVGVAFVLPYMIETALTNPGVPCTLVWMIRDIAHHPGRDSTFTALFDAVTDQLVSTVTELTARSSQAAEAIKRAPLLINLHLTSPTSSATTAPFVPIAELEKHQDASTPQQQQQEGAGEKDGKLTTDSSSESSDRAGTPRTPTEGFYAHLEPYFSMTTSYGRASPSISHHLGPSSSSSLRGKKKRLVVMACGPVALCDDVRYEANRELVGGQWADVLYHQEAFDW
ncbi:hypothetical protein V8E36_005901 [Tilletia maclaganii]